MITLRSEQRNKSNYGLIFQNMKISIELKWHLRIFNVVALIEFHFSFSYVIYNFPRGCVILALNIVKAFSDFKRYFSVTDPPYHGALAEIQRREWVGSSRIPVRLNSYLDIFLTEHDRKVIQITCYAIYHLHFYWSVSLKFKKKKTFPRIYQIL